MRSPDISVVIATYNRATLLERSLNALFEQQSAGESVEVIVVDNNCSDNTADVVRRLQSGSTVDLRYMAEPRQGNAYARNAGIAESRAPIVAFTDDDVCVSRDWIRSIVEAFAASPRASFVGGPVLPEWSAPPPSWLTQENWAPIGAINYGTELITIDASHLRCLLTGNLAIRRDVLRRVGLFNPLLQRVKNGIGSVEDHDLINRLCRAGETGYYVPAICTSTHVEAERLSRQYHRRWHRGHGRFYAVLRDPEWERSGRYVLSSPAHVYRSLVAAMIGWVSGMATRKANSAFGFEMQLWFSLGFLRQRLFGRA